MQLFNRSISQACYYSVESFLIFVFLLKNGTKFSNSKPELSPIKLIIRKSRKSKHQGREKKK